MQVGEFNEISMQVTEFNNNTPGQLGTMLASGQPGLITYQRSHRPYARVLSSELYDDLVEAAGLAGQDVLKRHREATEQQEHGAA